MPCGMALHDYRISCKQELYGLSKHCSELCQLAIISLATTSEGFEYLYCDCADNDYCRLIRRRMQSCDPRAHAKNRLDQNSHLIPCKGAEQYCKSNDQCNEAFTHYMYMCKNAIDGVECSRKCNNSISILWRQKAGVNLRNCSCEKTDTACVKRTENIMKLCYGLTDFQVGLTNADHAAHQIRSDRIFPFVSFYLSFASLFRSIY
ncbi:growth arrest-specific protein 1-like protein [Leptotrombidium deliense]|uniref:Growth arrest-specific protein 1-like protein n=1 Tax=Leptotrombidium deliense TaxID=299467 RepID=A0A443SF51_9ACAR|nr:growth arrest-specific protein 1-like protein [Leptotrombidium deliense]